MTPVLAPWAEVCTLVASWDTIAFSMKVFGLLAWGGLPHARRLARGHVHGQLVAARSRGWCREAFRLGRFNEAVAAVKHGPTWGAVTMNVDTSC